MGFSRVNLLFQGLFHTFLFKIWERELEWLFVLELFFRRKFWEPKDLSLLFSYVYNHFRDCIHCNDDDEESTSCIWDPIGKFLLLSSSSPSAFPLFLPLNFFPLPYWFNSMYIMSHRERERERGGSHLCYRWGGGIEVWWCDQGMRQKQWKAADRWVSVLPLFDNNLY